jgi:hypothetical protein
MTTQVMIMGLAQAAVIQKKTPLIGFFGHA